MSAKRGRGISRPRRNLRGLAGERGREWKRKEKQVGGEVGEGSDGGQEEGEEDAGKVLNEEEEKVRSVPPSRNVCAQSARYGSIEPADLVGMMAAGQFRVHPPFSRGLFFVFFCLELVLAIS